jgi:hypothetical protein
MYIEGMPGCCTSAILYGFGEHGEQSEMYAKSLTEAQKIESIRRHVESQLEVVDLGGKTQSGHKRCVFAISVDPANIRLLMKAGFEEIHSYEGVQGTVHVLTFTAPEFRTQ